MGGDLWQSHGDGLGPLPPPILDVPPPFGLQDTLPAAFSYRNVGEVIDKGAELSFNYRPSLAWSAATCD